jgi:K(+)-stimulated pyrophosphate-energized sodium pump
LTRSQAVRLRPLVGQPYATEEQLVDAVRNTLGGEHVPSENMLRPQINLGQPIARPDYRRCLELATQGSMRSLLLPVTFGLVTPLAVGYLFGPESLAAMLLGGLASGLVLAIASINAGGCWESAKGSIEAGPLPEEGSLSHSASVVGDAVGDSFKDASGAALSAFVKLQAMVSLVFAPVFDHGLRLLG